jgi:CRISPR-associated endonuclease Cas1
VLTHPGPGTKGQASVQRQRTTELPAVPVSRSGVGLAEGFGLRICVHRGLLRIEDGVDGGRRTELVRSTSRGVRIVLLGRAGNVSVEALRWIGDVGAALSVIDAGSGRLIAAAEPAGSNSPQLRRAQAFAPTSDIGLRIASRLIRMKIAGQLEQLERWFPTEPELQSVADRLDALEEAPNLAAVRQIEAEAANDYWGAWRKRRLTFVRRDERSVPEHWSTFPGRRSWVAGTSPRMAGCPTNSMLNLGYAFGELEARIACLTAGLDPGLGVIHTDQKSRDSMALDLLEGSRHIVDGWVRELIANHAFSKGDFYETRRGVFRVGTDLARAMAEQLLPALRRSLGPIAEEVAAEIGSSTDRPLRSAPRVREPRRSRGRGRTSVRAVASTSCLVCDSTLATTGRKVCDACLPVYDAERTKKLSSAGKATLAAMRAADIDPAQTPQARAKRAAKSRSTTTAMRAWEREHGRGDPAVYDSEVVPRLAGMSVPQLASLTGLSRFHCGKVKRGERRLHARHWDQVIAAKR